MARKQKKETGEQLELIDVGPKDGKEIMAAARLYQKHQAARLKALEKEIEQKTLILELVKKAKLQPLAGGVIKFRLDGMTITIKPRDELVQVKETMEPKE